MPRAILQDSEEQIDIRKIICIGRNYADHAKEMSAEVPTVPVFFLKPTTAIVSTGGSVIIPSVSSDVHHEVELTVLLAKGGSLIPEKEALEYVAGYGVGLDMTLRDVQAEAKRKGLPWTLAKGFDTSAPLSSFVPASRVQDPHALDIQLNVNGEPRQSSNTKNLIFTIQHLISYISQSITLERGDVIFTGTPEGVGPVRAGDVLEASLRTATGEELAAMTVTVREAAG